MVENQSAGALCTVEPYIFNDRYVKDRGEPTMKQSLRRGGRSGQDSLDLRLHDDALEACSAGYSLQGGAGHFMILLCVWLSEDQEDGVVSSFIF